MCFWSCYPSLGEPPGHETVTCDSLIFVAWNYLSPPPVAKKQDNNSGLCNDNMCVNTIN